MHRSLALVLAALLLLAGAPPLGAQESAGDTLRAPREPLFSRRDAAGLGAVALGTGVLLLLDEPIYDLLQEPTLQDSDFIREGVDGISNIHERTMLMLNGGMYAVGTVAKLAGVSGADRVADWGLHGSEAILLAWGVSGVLKQLSGRPRPKFDDDPFFFSFGRGADEGEYRAFPSLHAAGAFAAFSVAVEEVRRSSPQTARYLATVLYTTGGLVAVSRVYQGDHWISDSFFGTAVGIFFGTKVVRFHHSHPNNFFDRVLLHTSITPAAGGGMRIGVSHSF